MRRAAPGGALVLALLAGTLAAAPARAAWREPYPETPVRTVVDTLHGVAVPDPYRWLEDGTSPEVRDWTDLQNALTRRALENVQGRVSLRGALQRLYRIPTLGQPRLAEKRLFWEKREEGQDQPVVYVQDFSTQFGPHVLVNPNTLSLSGPVAIDWRYPSPDGKFLVYGTSVDGSEHSTLHLLDVLTGFDRWDSIPNTQNCSVAWDPDGAGYVYTRHPAAGDVARGQELLREDVYHHRLGDEWRADLQVYFPNGSLPQEQRRVYASADHRWTFLSTSLDWIRNDLYVRAAGSQDPFRPVALGQDGQVFGEAAGSRLYLLTNANGASRFHVLMTDVSTPVFGGREIVPEGRGVIRGMTLAGGRLVLRVEEDAHVSLKIYDLDGALQREVALPAPGDVRSVTGDPAASEFYFEYTSYVHPPTVYACNVENGLARPLETFYWGYDPALYSVRRVEVTSLDGTQVPLSIVGRAGYVNPGGTPTILTGYGGFGISQLPAWTPMFQAWIDQGGLVAYAALRGGGEFGKRWHEDGRLSKKQKVFDDFQSCAQWLCDHNITDRPHLACYGASNGGLLVGAAVTQHPEMWKAAVCRVPLLDMLRYQDFLLGRLWVPEYGSAENRDAFEWLYAYSPYHHVKPGTAYPATLLMASEGDARVDPLHARKMAARLQAASAGDAPILLRVESHAGHGKGKPVTRRLEDAMDILMFLSGPAGIGLGWP